LEELLLIFITNLDKKKLGKKVFTVKQASKQGGIMTICQEGDRFYLTGQVQLFMEGDIPFDL